MQTRPIWQVVGGVILFACLQSFFENPQAFLTPDRLITAQFWLVRIIVLFVVLYALERLGKRGGEMARALVTDDDRPVVSVRRRPWLPVLSGLVIVVCVLAVLEHQQPFFFTQDDNLMQFLPVILQGCRSFFQGVFPTWNPYQLLGAPTTTLGVYALTYPITYISYFISRYLLGNEFLTIEIYCLLHIVAGYFALYWAVRCNRVRPSLAATAALCAVLSGWSLIATRSWFYVSPIFLYVPLMIVGVSKLTSGSGNWKWIGGMAMVLALFFHAGNVQFWVYGLLFLWTSLLISWGCGLIDRVKVLTAVVATLLGLALVSPLLVPQFLQTRKVFRIMVPDVGVLEKQWQAFFLPGPWIHAYSPANSLDPDWRTGGLIVYSGTTFVLLAILLVPCFAFYRVPKKELGRNVWFFSALIAFLAAIGRPGVLWSIMLLCPLLSKFRIPIKFLAFFNIFIVLVGAMMLERLLRRVRWSKQLEFCTVVGTICLVAAAGMGRMPSWYAYGVKPYPRSTPRLEQIADDHAATYRIMSLTFERSPSPGYWEELPHNLGTIYNVPALHGYDPLVSFSPQYRKVMETFEQEPVKTLQEYGVQYVLEPADFNRPKLSGYAGSHRAESSNLIPKQVRAAVSEQSLRVFIDDEVSVRHISGARPLAFAEAQPAVSLPLHMRADGFDIDSSSLKEGGRVVANFLWYPEIRAEAGGKRLPVGDDSYQRIVVDVPHAAGQIHVRFVPPWWKGFAAGAVMALVGMVLGYFAIRREQNVNVFTAAAGS